MLLLLLLLPFPMLHQSFGGCSRNRKLGLSRLLFGQLRLAMR
jgi:hypothetical protein